MAPEPAPEARDRGSHLTRYVERLNRRLDGLARQSTRWTRARVGFASAVAIGLLASFVAEATWVLNGAILLSAVGFIGSVLIHGRVQRAIARAEHWRAIKRTHLARQAQHWDELPEPRSEAADERHPFADLHLVGEGSLHQLLDVAVTDGGSERLRDWLLETELDPEQMRRRQSIVRELVPRSRFRDKLCFAARRDVATQATRHGAPRVVDWLEADHTEDGLRPMLAVLGGLALLNVGLVGGWLLGALPPLWLGSLVSYVVLYYRQARHVGTLFAEASTLERLLGRLRSIFRELETVSYADCPELGRHCLPFRDPHRQPSAELARVSRVAGAASMQRHPLWLPLNLLVPWDLYFAHRLRSLKSSLAEELSLWLERWFDLEALIGLANFADLHPDYAFPQFRSPSDDNRVPFEASALGHPLIPRDHRVSNDFATDGLGSITIVTGSNMAGKSTFLRTIGINLRLAFAGGPVCAAALSTIPLRLYTCIRPSDSIADGISHFYAEVKRLRTLLDELDRGHPYPVFFLIDEIFSATNNRERLLGSRAYVEHLVDKHGVGVISTHDLELAQLEDESNRIRNMHFREHVADGAMHFDYTLREGPCPTTNALTIMEMEGLPATSERPASGSSRSGR